MSQQYGLILNAYRQSLAVFEREKPPVSWNEVLKILVLRDRLQFLLSKSGTITAEQLIELAGYDQILKRYQDKIAIQSELDEWRQRLHPPQSSWWWWMKFEKPQHWWNRYDWLFSAGTLIMLTISASLITDTTARLFAGGINLESTLLVSGQSVLALLASGGALSKAGRQTYERVLSSFNIKQPFWQETSFGFSVILVLFLAGFHAGLPWRAESSNRSGKVNFEAGRLDSARRDFQRAIALRPDYGKAHFNLGLVFEDLGQAEKAKEAYQLVVTRKLEDCTSDNAEDCCVLTWLKAHNNLARLQILDKNEAAAAPLLQFGLRRLTQTEVEANATGARLKYRLLKNLGWVRLNQSFYVASENILLEAIDLDSSLPDAHCLLAQLFEAQNQTKMAIASWERCASLANQNPFVLETQPEVNEWAAKAQEQLSEQAFSDSDEVSDDKAGDKL